MKAPYRYRNLLITWFILLIVTIFLFSCSPQRRLNRLIIKHPELSTSDTLIIRDTTILPQTKIDTAVHFKYLLDTITITKEKLHVKIHQKLDTVYVYAKCDADTVVVEKEVVVEIVKEINIFTLIIDFIQSNLIFIIIIFIFLFWLKK